MGKQPERQHIFQNSATAARPRHGAKGQEDHSMTEKDAKRRNTVQNRSGHATLSTSSQTTQFGRPSWRQKANVRKLCYSITVMRIQPPDPARNTPEIPPISESNTPLRKKNIGRHLGTFGDIWGHMSHFHAKTSGLRPLTAKAAENRLVSTADVQIMGPMATWTRINLRGRKDRTVRFRNENR